MVVHMHNMLDSEVGLNFLVDSSGKLLTKKHFVTKKDVSANPRAT